MVRGGAQEGLGGLRKFSFELSRESLLLRWQVVFRVLRCDLLQFTACGISAVNGFFFLSVDQCFLYTPQETCHLSHVTDANHLSN